jgi:hypothetical protein
VNRWRLSYDKGRKRERVHLENAGAFDEFVLLGRKGRCLIHAEVMDDSNGRRHVWMQVGDAAINIIEERSGVTVHVERDEYPDEART